MTLNRRKFLALTGLSASLSATGAALSTVDARAEALTRAKSQGKPLLVAWIPKSPSGAHQRGLMWAQLLRMGSDREVAILALCEVVFATPTETEAAGAKESAGKVFFHDGRDSVDVALPNLEDVTVHYGPGNAHQAIALSLTRVLAPEPQADQKIPHEVFERFSQYRNVIGQGPKSNIRPRLKDVDGAASYLWQSVVNDPASADYWLPFLAGAALARLYEVDPPGARWQEQHADPCPPCGMAIIPPASREFLQLYTK